MPEPRLKSCRYQMLELHQIPRDENTFIDWLVDARTGDMLAYYRGHLAFDRDPQQSKLGEFRRLKLTHLADRVMETHARTRALVKEEPGKPSPRSPRSPTPENSMASTGERLGERLDEPPRTFPDHDGMPDWLREVMHE